MYAVLHPFRACVAQLLAGSASFLLPSMVMGAVGGVCALANIAAQPLLDMIAAYKAGDLEKAADLQLTMVAPNNVSNHFVLSIPLGGPGAVKDLLFQTSRYPSKEYRNDSLFRLPRSFFQAVTAQFGVPGLKAALDGLGYYGGPVRKPMLPLSEAEVTTLHGILREGGVMN